MKADAERMVPGGSTRGAYRHGRVQTEARVCRGKSPGEQDIVLPVNVLVHVDLELGQATEQGPVGIAGVGGRRVVAGQGPHTRQGGPGVVMLLFQGTNRVGDVAGREFAAAHPGLQPLDPREDDPLLLVRVGLERLPERGEHVTQLPQLGTPLPCASATLAASVGQPRQFPAQVRVMGGHDIVRELGHRRGEPFVGRGRPRPGVAGLELPEDRLRVEPLRRARPRERHPPAAAIVDAEPLEDAGTSGSFGHQLSDGQVRVKRHHDRGPPGQAVCLSRLPGRRDAASASGSSPGNPAIQRLRVVTA